MSKPDGRVKRLLRIPPSVDEVLVAYALEHDLNINEAACEAFQRLGQPRHAPADAPVEKQAWTHSRKKPMQVKEKERTVLPIRCPHPRPAWKKLAYGTLCEDCGRLIRR